METNEIMNNEEVMDTTEEIVKTASKGGFRKVTTIGVAMIAGGLAYKFVVAPAVSKLKEMKARKGFRVVENETTVEDENTETVDENDSEN
jgi:hypothetical protein